MKRRLIGSMSLACGFAAQAQTAPESTLDVVMKQGGLRACTPDDYQPFSFLSCDDMAKFQRVADIDKAGVRVIANPGGSNERFAKANFKTATPTIHDENLTIFDEILAKRAEVFKTEAAEALTQRKFKPGLCAIDADEPLQYGEMAWRLPRGDAPMKGFVDQWLHHAKATGEYQRTADKWLK